ncbi:hypothetical protein ACHAXA_007754 [Cyclostephanos tholiformis]|uniref:Uncharacterized protein n=1 Tax=Cyclostephanos tholiformis TaxID=382380 RepID=A0ABD3RAV0_9STRA
MMNKNACCNSLDESIRPGKLMYFRQYAPLYQQIASMRGVVLPLKPEDAALSLAGATGRNAKRMPRGDANNHDQVKANFKYGRSLDRSDSPLVGSPTESSSTSSTVHRPI